MQRPTEVAKLSRLLHETTPGLRIAEITGPGGVGKSYLVNEVLSREKPSDLEFMHLAVDAANPQTRGDFFGLVGQLATRVLPPPASQRVDYFPRIRDVAAAYRRIVDEASSEVSKTDARKEVQAAVSALFRAAHVLNKAVPKSRLVLDVAGLNLDEAKVAGVLSDAWDAAVDVLTLRHSTFLRPLLDLVGVAALEDRVRRELYKVTAESLFGDLTNALDKYRKDEAFRFKRVLIVLDDFEATAAVLGDFLVGELLRLLAAAPFPTIMFIASRDKLEALNLGFGQYAAQQWFAERIELHSFDRAAAFELMTERGIPAEKQQQLFEATHGFPYLLALAIEEATAPDAEAALFTKMLFDRTTKWMTERQRDWFTALCYLDVVNEDTIGDLLPGENRKEVQKWFEGESSIRDPFPRVFSIRPLVREKCLQYFAIRSPRTHWATVERASAINRQSREIAGVSI